MKPRKQEVVIAKFNGSRRRCALRDGMRGKEKGTIVLVLELLL